MVALDTTAQRLRDTNQSKHDLPASFSPFT
jgi:hypothetical protein